MTAHGVRLPPAAPSMVLTPPVSSSLPLPWPNGAAAGPLCAHAGAPASAASGSRQAMARRLNGRPMVVVGMIAGFRGKYAPPIAADAACAGTTPNKSRIRLGRRVEQGQPIPRRILAGRQGE